MKNSFLLLLLTFLMVTVSCKKQETVSDEPTQSLRSSVPAGFPTLDAFREDAIITYAQALAKAMNHYPELRSLVKSRALLQFDGDYDILHTTIKNEEILPGMSFSLLLSQHANRPVSYFNDELPRYFPTLNIMLPEVFEPETWTTETFAPAVVAVPYSFHDGDELMLNAYTPEGTPFQVSSYNEPATLTVSVGNSERIVAFAQPYSGINTGQLYSDEHFVFFSSENIVNEEGMYGRSFTPEQNDEGVPNGTNGCDRDNSNKYDIVHGFKVSNNGCLNRLESWVKGKIELYFYVLHNNNANNPTLASSKKVLASYKRNDLKNGAWKTISVTIVKWQNQNLYGDRMKYVWFEDDGGNSRNIPVSLTVTIKGVTVTITTNIESKSRDDEAGEQVVEYCDAVKWGGTDYNTGCITFNVRI